MRLQSRGLPGLQPSEGLTGVGGGPSEMRGGGAQVGRDLVLALAGSLRSVSPEALPRVA